MFLVVTLRLLLSCGLLVFNFFPGMMYSATQLTLTLGGIGVCLVAMLALRAKKKGVPCHLCGKPCRHEKKDVQPTCPGCKHTARMTAHPRRETAKGCTILAIVWGLAALLIAIMTSDWAWSPWWTWYAALAIGLPAIAAVAFVSFMIARMSIAGRRLRNEDYDLVVARRESGGEGAVVRRPNMTIWLAEQTSFC